MVAAAVAGSALASVAGGAISSGSASDAADTQAAAAQQASNQQLAQYQQTRSDLQPYTQAGYSALGTLQQQLPQLTSQFNPTEAQLEATPGYQFSLNQGLQGVQNAASAKGLGISGAALKGAADYATGLADNTYSQQFNIDQANKTNAYNKLLGLVGAGQSSAAQTGTFGQQATQNSGNYLTSGANAQASGDIGSANALTSGLNGAANAATNYTQLNNLNNTNAAQQAAAVAQTNYYNKLTAAY